MNNEPQIGDPPELLAIKRAFKQVPDKIRYVDGTIRFTYLLPLDFAPGILWLCFLIITTYFALASPANSGFPFLPWISFLSASVLPGCFYLKWLLPRFRTTLVLSKDGIGLERKGALVQSYRWNEVSRMTVGLNPSSPIYIWSATGLLGEIPTLYSVLSTTTSDYRLLQASILTAYSGSSAPLFRDHVSEYELAGKGRWLRFAAPAMTMAASVVLIVVGAFLNSPIGMGLIFAFVPIIPISGLWLVFALSEISEYHGSKRVSKPLSIISIGNSNLGFDLRNHSLAAISSRTTYRSSSEQPAPTKISTIASFVVLIFISLFICVMLVAPFIAMLLLFQAIFGKFFGIVLALAIPASVIGTAVITVRMEQLVRRDSGALLQFDEEGANVISAGKIIPVDSFGRSRQSYKEFKPYPKLEFGVLRVSAGGKNYYFSPSKMVTVSDHEMMNFLPEFD